MAQSLMRELGALMNSVAGVNPNDDVAVLTETLKSDPEQDLGLPANRQRADGFATEADEEPVRSPPPPSSCARLVTMPDHPEHPAQACYQ